MKDRIKYLAFYYLFWLLVFISQKPVFMLFQWNQSKEVSLSEWLGVMVHGLPMDCSTAGYLTLPVILLLLVSCFVKCGSWLSKTILWTTVVLLVIACLAFVADMFLYPFWGFRLDITPLFYMQTPKDAAASGTASQYLLSVVIYAVEFAVYFLLFRWLHKKVFSIETACKWAVIPLLVILPLLVIVIRGGVDVSVMNAGRVYFSKNVFVNHSAINPIWNFLSSFGKETDFGQQYRFMDDDKAQALFVDMRDTANYAPDTMLLNTQRPNVIYVILESFGANICEAAGGAKGLTPNLDRYAKEGIFFADFYANSYRTDRGLVAILSSYPGQPVTSLMKYPNKAQNVPMVSQKLKDAGYDLSFYYGGDENFTNMRSYLVTGGFDKRVSENDFSAAELSTKWGAYDHLVFQRCLKDLRSDTLRQPFYDVVLTLNSHEPYDVPFHKFAEPYPNSVAYTDSCLGAFLDSLKTLPIWKNTLVVLLPDHARPYPETMTNQEVARYKALMVWTGGAVKHSMRVEQVCSQIDLTRTLLAQMGLNGSDFVFSKNIFANRSPKFAFYAFNEGLGFVGPDNSASVYDCGGNVSIREDNPELTTKGKAFLQCLFDDLAKR